jgi:DegV family protein with EDD domain
MPSICILTDASAQFTYPNFPGHELVYIIPFNSQNIANLEGRPLPDGVLAHTQLVCPSPQDFVRFYTSLSRGYDTILVLTISSLLDSTMKNALLALDEYSHCARVEVIDSQTTAIGLGMLVQLAASAASKGASLKEIDRQLRAGIPRIYTLFCIPELTYLATSDLMNYSQTLVAEMMGMLPIFAFEEGRLVPMEKVRTPRHLFAAFQDFISEFESPAQIVLLRNSVNGHLRTNPFRIFVSDNFPDTLFSEHPLQPHLAALFGPRSIGLVVMES